jgi:peptidoglycan/xylan/chitin deacetylase (PgdA/CDA1 family)
MKAQDGFLSRNLKRLGRKAQTLRSEHVCSRQSDPLAGQPNMTVTIFYDVEGDYAMPGQSAASIEAVGQILEMEKRHGIRSTYNVVARYALDAPDIVTEIRDAGHEIASHSYDHTVLSGLSTGEIADNLRRTKSTFQQLGIDICGHRSPQSAWNGNVLSSLIAEGYTWSAEDGREPYPYRIRMNDGKELWRFPTADDDWCYQQNHLTPRAALERWQQRIRQARDHQTYVAIGFHPWVEASADRLAVLDEFFHWLSEEDGLQVLPFGDVLGMIRKQNRRAFAGADV